MFCWCPGSLRRQDISSHVIDYYMKYAGPSLIWEMILSTCVKSMWRNDIKGEYMFMFPSKNLACKGLSEAIATHLKTDLQVNSRDLTAWQDTWVLFY